MRKLLILCWTLLMIVAGCSIETWFGELLTKQGGHGPQCNPPQDSFTEGDLVGTWIAGSPDQRDILIINADGTYKQIIHIEHLESPSVDYASESQQWWLESENVTIPVLHLQGWRLCGYNPDMSCEISGGSGFHMCEVEYKDVPGEGVLYVMGGSELTLTLPLLENSWFYHRQEP